MTPFLNYYKTILAKVSFDKRLFLKEYCKAANNLSQKEKFELDEWLAAGDFEALNEVVDSANRSSTKAMTM